LITLAKYSVSLTAVHAPRDGLVGIPGSTPPHVHHSELDGRGRGGRRKRVMIKIIGE
jgi:hypothetical protein